MYFRILACVVFLGIGIHDCQGELLCYHISPLKSIVVVYTCNLATFNSLS